MLARSTWLRLVLIAALCCIAVGVVFFVGSDTGTPSAGSGQTELRNLDEKMLIGESDVPPLKGTTWGSMVAIPRGPQPSVSPCPWTARVRIFLRCAKSAESSPTPVPE
jgi:hypothetical protein